MPPPGVASTSASPKPRRSHTATRASSPAATARSAASPRPNGWTRRWRSSSRLPEAAIAPTSSAPVGTVEQQLEGFRAAPLAPAEQARRAGQLDRFLRLVPIEYDRGVEGGRVTLAFEIQEAISFRDAAAAALADIAPTLLQRDATATRELTGILVALGTTLDAAGGGRAVAPAERVSAQAKRSLDLIDGALSRRSGRRRPPAPTST